MAWPSFNSNILKYYLFCFFGGFIFTYTIKSIFLLSRGFTLDQLALTASIMIIFSTLMEIPTGFIADKFGRKLSVSLSHAISGLAFMIYAFVGNFSMLVVISLLFGLSTALESGALQSLIYDDLKATERETDYLKITTTGTNVAILAGVVTTFLGPIFYQFNQSLPFVLCAIASAIMAVIIMFFDEKKTTGEVARDIHILEGIKSILMIRPILFIVLIDLLLLVFVNIYYQVLFFPKITAIGMPVPYLGVLDGVTLAITSGILFFAAAD